MSGESEKFLVCKGIYSKKLFEFMKKKKRDFLLMRKKAIRKGLRYLQSHFEHDFLKFTEASELHKMINFSPFFLGCS